MNLVIGSAVNFIFLLSIGLCFDLVPYHVETLIFIGFPTSFIAGICVALVPISFETRPQPYVLGYAERMFRGKTWWFVKLQAKRDSRGRFVKGHTKPKWIWLLRK